MFKVSKQSFKKCYLPLLKQEIESKMSYSESELQLDSNFAINSVSDFDSDSGSDSKSKSDSSSAFMNLLILAFLLCIYVLQEKYADKAFFRSS